MLAAVLAVSPPPPARATHAIPSRNLDLTGHFNDFPPVGGARYSSCWHYVHGDGREYAVIGHQRGIGIYNVTNPHAAYLVDSIPGPPNGWREMKSYRNWIYVVSEANGVAGAGLQIVRMTDPENPVLAATYTATFTSAHTVTIDTTRALLFANGARTSAPNAPAGMRILSLANPEAPVEVGRWPAEPPFNDGDYVHDGALHGTTYYAACIYGGAIRVLNTANPAATFEADHFGYWDSRLPHNAWPDPTGQYLYATDETNGMPLAVFDVSSYPTPFKLPLYEWTANPQATVHNAHANGTDLIVAHYTEGVWALDITDPRHPAAFGHADTYPGPTGGYKGCWGVDPYLPSGLVIASDMSTGLYLFEIERDYGVVRLHVTDAGTGEPMDSVWVHSTATGDSLETPFYGDGVVAFAPPPGVRTFVVKRFGWETAVVTATVTAGSSQTIAVPLARKPVVTLAGVVRDAVTQAPLEGVQVDLVDTPVHAHDHGGGVYMLHDVPDDTYRVAARRPGYVPVSFVRRIGPGFDGVQDFHLQPVRTWDALEVGAGWTVSSDVGHASTAEQGRWMRVEPRGTTASWYDPLSPPPPGHAASRGTWRDAVRPVVTPLHEDHEGSGATLGQVQPEWDRSPDPDSLCFVTGNLSSIFTIDQTDVDLTTTLTSPPFDCTGLVEPTIGVWMWFYSQFRHPDDYLAVLMSGNGTTWVPVDTLRGTRNHWMPYAYRVADHVAPTTQVRLRFVAVDGGEASVVEAAVDDVSVYDGASIPVGVIEGAPAPGLGIEAAWPNPVRDALRLVLRVPGTSPVRVEVLDVAGRLVRTLHEGPAAAGTLTLHWSGEGERGRRAPAGLYFVRARAGAATSVRRVVRL